MIERLVKDKRKILNKQIFSDFKKYTSPLLNDDFFGRNTPMLVGNFTLDS
jgi:hypothetical protein